MWYDGLGCKKLAITQLHSSDKNINNFFFVPGHTDVADTVSKIAVTCEAGLYGLLRFLTAALGPDRQRNPGG